MVSFHVPVCSFVQCDVIWFSLVDDEFFDPPCLFFFFPLSPCSLFKAWEGVILSPDYITWLHMLPMQSHLVDILAFTFTLYSRTPPLPLHNRTWSSFVVVRRTSVFYLSQVVLHFCLTDFYLQVWLMPMTTNCYHHHYNNDENGGAWDVYASWAPGMFCFFFVLQPLTNIYLQVRLMPTTTNWTCTRLEWQVMRDGALDGGKGSMGLRRDTSRAPGMFYFLYILFVLTIFYH